MPRIPSESVTTTMSMSSAVRPLARSDSSMSSGESMDRNTPSRRVNWRLNCSMASPMVGV